MLVQNEGFKTRPAEENHSIIAGKLLRKMGHDRAYSSLGSPNVGDCRRGPVSQPLTGL